MTYMIAQTKKQMQNCRANSMLRILEISRCFTSKTENFNIFSISSTRSVLTNVPIRLWRRMSSTDTTLCMPCGWPRHRSDLQSTRTKGRS